MIKIRIRNQEFTLNGKVWSGERQDIADIFTSQSASRPFRYERRVERCIADYIVEQNKDRGAEIIYDSEEGKNMEPEEPGYYS